MVRASLDFHWLHEVSGGLLDADFGRLLDVVTPYEATRWLSGNFLAEVSIETNGGRRLVIRKEDPREPLIAARVRPTGQPTPGEPDARGPLLAELLGIAEPAELIEKGLRSLDAFECLPISARQQVKHIAGPVRREKDLWRLCDRISDAIVLRDRILTSAGEALEQKIAADLACQLQRAQTDKPFLDATFAPGEKGFGQYRRCREGDLTAALGESVRLDDCILLDMTSEKPVVELHMPFLERTWWNRRLDLFRQMRPEVTGGGRVHVFTAVTPNSVEAHNGHQGALMLTGSLFRRDPAQEETFTLRAEDRRIVTASHAAATLPALLENYGFSPEVWERVSWIFSNATVVHTGISFRLRGSLTSAWLEAPAERSIAFYEACTRVSSAVQRCLRLWLPYTYFGDADCYDDLDSALPLVAYQASKPYSRRARSEFTYDPMNPRSVSLALGHAGRRLAALLESVHTRLLAEGKDDIARHYKPSRAKKTISSLRRDPRRFKRLLAADAHLVGNLVNLANRGRALRADLETDPAEATKKVSHDVDYFVRACHHRLRRLYGGQDYSEFGSLLFVEATQALSAAFRSSAAIEAVLRVRVPGEAGEHVFVNDAYRTARRQ